MDKSINAPTKGEKNYDFVAFMTRFEGDADMTQAELVEGMQRLIDSGRVWKLQGCYGRLAQSMINRGLCARPSPAHAEITSQNTDAPAGQMLSDVGPYARVRRDHERVFENQRRLRFVLYSAYKANGLTGSECNGIVVLDQDNLRVVCDGIACEPSGANGATFWQNAMFDYLMAAPFEAVAEAINEHPRSRYPLE